MDSVDLKKIKQKKVLTAKLFILAAAFFSMVFSIYLFHSGDNSNAIYVGIWVPSILSAGCLIMLGYNE